MTFLFCFVSFVQSHKILVTPVLSLILLLFLKVLKDGGGHGEIMHLLTFPYLCHPFLESGELFLGQNHTGNIWQLEGLEK